MILSTYKDDNEYSQLLHSMKNYAKAEFNIEKFVMKLKQTFMKITLI